MLKHYCTVHFTDELTKYFDGNRCTICGNEFFSNKVSSMAIHVGLQHKVIHLGTTHELVLKFIENIASKTEQESGVQEKDTIPTIPSLEVMNKTCRIHIYI